MDMRVTNAALAYAQALNRQVDGAAGGGAADGGANGSSFAELVAAAAGQAIGAGHHAEVATLQSAQKKGDLTDIAVAVNNAEVTLDTVMAVRDKVIGAYQDIIKMPI
jgi:flagellar hook-basal body complex protein FliE